MRLRLLILSWLAAVALLAWPVSLEVMGERLVGCGPSGYAFADGMLTDAGFIEGALDDACAAQSYPYVAAAGALLVVTPLALSVGWRKRRQRRRLARQQVRREQQAVRQATQRLEAQRPAAARA